jgi:ADP-dependent NAD(P)H-hydrate dehydratase
MTAGSSEALTEIGEALLRSWSLPVPDGGDKEERGRVIIVGGSCEIPGAAVLAATAALRAGAGKVTIATPASIAQSVAFAVPESRVIALTQTSRGGIAADAGAPLEELVGKAKALLIGPGLLDEQSTCDLAASLLAMYSGTPIILDAGAMGIVSSGRKELTPFSSPVLMTPHAGEMASLTGGDKDDIAANPIKAAVDAARTWNAVVALKGAITHIAAPDGRVWRHEGGNSGLATSGSGDVLSGIIAGLLARGTSLEQASAWGVALHARAGCRLTEKYGPIGYLARELPGEVPALMAALA